MTMDKDDLEHITELIRKILALTKSPNEHEAALAAEKVQELLFKYHLSMAEVEAGNGENHEDEKVIQEYSELFEEKNEGRWKSYLASSVAQAHFCRILIISLHSWGPVSRKIMFIGKATDVGVAKEVFTWLAEQLEARASLSWKQYQGEDHRPMFMRSFLLSATFTVGGRMQSRSTQLKAESPQSMALVVYSDKLVEDYIKNHFSNLRAGRRAAIPGSSEGWSSGARHGKEVDISGPGKKLEAGGKNLLGG